jgi:hypothetical protein
MYSSGILLLTWAAAQSRQFPVEILRGQSFGATWAVVGFYVSRWIRVIHPLVH